jgi:hypothetical protein
MRMIILGASLALAASTVGAQAAPPATKQATPPATKQSSPPATRQASSRWKEIGKTTSGNLVYVDSRTITTKDGIITATVRVTYAEAVSTPKGPITGSRAVAMFDCAKQTIAVKENIIWHDERAGTMYSKSTPKVPGFGPAFPGTFAQVVMDHLCAGKPGS